MLRLGVVLAVVAAVGGCGSRSALEDDEFDASPGPVPVPETCNGLDDDLDESVDEDFRDDIGRYVHDDHCGGCDLPCRARVPDELDVACGIVDENPACVALECARGSLPSSTGRCRSAWARLCLPCVDDGDCGDVLGATCAEIGGEPRCAVGCEAGCPPGYVCSEDASLCVPESGSCSCEPGDSFTVACGLTDPEGALCVGSAMCTDGTLTECVAPEDVCDEVDNDCDGVVDGPFVNDRGGYIDIHNCGECGVDCTESAVPEGDLICGGDPFAPSCVLDCPDARDGVMPGDRIDADRDIATGCECTVGALEDVPGPVRTSGEDLDVNCDGADGIVIRSFYVAADGDDTGPGSPTRPMRTIDAALEAAAESLDTDDPRPHVFVASGSYTETVHVPDGVRLHGGYRRDFLALDPDGFRVEVRAPADTTAPGGAALDIRGAGERETVVEWIVAQGRDATTPGGATFGAYVLDPGPRLVLRDMEIRSGVAGAGMDGTDGEPGSPPTTPASEGEPPRGAVEDAFHECIPGGDNTVAGGAPGRNACDALAVHGGEGGSPSCPEFAAFQPSGERGMNAGPVSGGGGGAGGQDSQGPIMGSSCSEPVCCGLADFQVPSEFSGPEAGAPGGDGTDGSAGEGCRDALGRFDGDTWRGDRATRGTEGTAGSGGGGGGAGGGAVMNWVDGACEFADGLGGGGGGGGAGGCGGRGGRPGTSGGPSVAILLRYTAASATLPAIDDVIIAPADGGRGGDGGAGGEGGLGGSGAFGGEVPREDRSTPTLAGPFPGGRGGAGGNGGAGGGGGGGCGGGSIGVWITGLGSTEPPGTGAIRTGNDFRLGRGGVAGRGGGGVAAAADGEAGGAVDVVAR